MAFSEKLNFVITANASDAIKAFQATGKAADKELGKAQARIDKLGSGLTKFGAGAMAAAGIAGVGLYKLGQSASNLEESINAVNVTFGDASTGILDLSKDAAKAVGMSEVAFNGLAVQFSSFATTVAGEGGDVVQVMADITGRAADFASVMNLDVAEASRVFQSGLAGETEPLKKFGIDLSAAAVEAYAAANGIGELGKQLTEAEKVQARYGALMEQTSKTQGDFANTADGAANQQRVLKAELENLSASIGAGVLPVMTKVVTVVGDLVRTFDSLPGPVKKTGGAVLTFGTIALGAAGAISFVSGQVIKARDSFKSMGAAAVKAGPLVAVAAVAVVGFGLQARKTAKDNENLAASITELSRVSDADLMRQFVDALAAGMIAGKGQAETMRELARTNMDAAKRVLAHVDALEANGTATKAQIDGNKVLRDAIEEEEKALAQAAKTTKDASRVTADLGDKAANAAVPVGDMADALDKAAQRADDLVTSYDLLMESIDEDQALIDAQDQFDDLRTKAEEAFIAAAEGSADAEQAARDYQTEINNTKRMVAEYGKEVLGLPDDEITRIIAEIDWASVDDAEATFRNLARTRNAWIQVNTRGGLYAGGPDGYRAAGGPVSAGGTYVVGEEGPELLTMGASSGFVTPNDALTGGSAGATYNVTVNGANMTADQVVAAIKAWERRNGPGWRS